MTIRVLQLFVILSGVLAMVACDKTYQTGTGMGKVEESGFLGDYSILRPGQEGEATLVYRKYENDHAKWRFYSQILLEPVQIWKGKNTELSKEDAEYLAKIAWSRLDEELRKDYKMASGPSIGVLRIQVAITEAGATVPVVDLITTLYPGTRLVSEGKRWATGTESFAATVSVEAKVTDSQSGEVLGAAVDRRGGGKYVTKGFQKWTDVEEAFTYWAKQLRWRLCLGRGVPGCDLMKPEA
jgi:Protein of unknown function (DUF3313)